MWLKQFNQLMLSLSLVGVSLEPSKSNELSCYFSKEETNGAGCEKTGDMRCFS